MCRALLWLVVWLVTDYLPSPILLHRFMPSVVAGIFVIAVLPILRYLHSVSNRAFLTMNGHQLSSAQALKVHVFFILLFLMMV